MKKIFQFFKKKAPKKLPIVESKPAPSAQKIKELEIKDAMKAIENNDLAVFKKICDKTPQLVNFHTPANLTIFFYAVWFGRLSIVNYCLTLPTLYLNAVQSNHYTYSWEGRSALHIATENLYKNEVAIALIQAGIDLNIISPPIYVKAIHVAAKKGKLEIIKAILVKDASQLNTLDYWQQTPLMWAAGHGQTLVVKYLLQQPRVDVDAFANYAAREHERKTALAWAVHNSHWESAALLKEYGRQRVVKFFDQATNQYFPSDLVNLISQYDDPVPRLMRV